MKQQVDIEPMDHETISQRFVMYALCILLPFLGIGYGLSLTRRPTSQDPQDVRRRLGKNLVLAGVAGIIWWVSSCGILWLALMAVLKTIHLVP